MGQYNLNAPQAGIARSSLNLQGFTAEKQFAKMDAFFGACSDTKMILVVIPENRPTLYAIIKFLADVKYGIHTICAEASNVHKKPRYSYFRGIAQKFNTKAGGINRCLPDETLRNFLPDKTMIAGIQVTSPVPKNQANATLSIVGVVANINENCAQWPASVRTQENSGTIADDIGGMLAERLRCWKRKNDHLPENILIYRNGMFENLTTVLEKEGEFIHTAVKTSYSGRRLPKLTIITVNKSHKTRFYPTKGASGNPQNGTVVDQDVTSTTQDEFYLQAHAGNEKSGSLCPTKYVISRNGMNLTADRVQQLVSFFHLLYSLRVCICDLSNNRRIISATCPHEPRGRCQLSHRRSTQVWSVNGPVAMHEPVRSHVMEKNLGVILLRPRRCVCGGQEAFMKSCGIRCGTSSVVAMGRACWGLLSC